MICFAIKDLNTGRYFSHDYKWDKQLRKALLYVNEKRAIEMGDREEVNYQLVKVKIEEVRE